MILSRSCAFQAATHSSASFQASSFVTTVPPIDPSLSPLAEFFPQNAFQGVGALAPTSQPAKPGASAPEETLLYSSDHYSVRTTPYSLLFHTFPQPYQTNHHPTNSFLSCHF